MSLSQPNNDAFNVALPVKYEALSSFQRKKVREQYVLLQHHKCWCCGETLHKPAPAELQELPIDWSLFPENFLQYPIHLQHNHNTGLTEGAVHSFCNAFLWHYFRR